MVHGYYGDSSSASASVQGQESKLSFEGDEKQGVISIVEKLRVSST